MITQSYKALTSRPVLVLAAALAILMLAAPFVFAATSVNYPENSMESVATFSADDQDGDAIVWSLGGDDAGDFTIAGGVLMFKKSPNYESPADKDTDNEYKVTVQATGGTEEITVTVTNVDEAGSVRMSDLQPQIGKPVTATLSDPDGQHTRTRWQWSRSADNSAWTDIAGARSASYSPVSGDAGMYLRAMATYYDPLGEDAETAMGATDFMVEGEPAINAPPKFPDQDPGEAGVQNAVAMLEVNEETAAGTSIGDPMVATDADNDPLLYAFDDTPDLKDGPNNDVARFTIDNETGQIKVGKKLGADDGQSEDEGSSGVTDLPTELTAEDTGDEVNEAAENNNMYILKVTATDPSGAPATIFVVVTVKEVDEAPTFAPAPANPSSIKVTEGMQIGAGENPAGVTYVATDPEGATNEVAYTLAGDDVAKFSLPENGAGGVLTFKGETSTDDGYFRPNFESPADKNKDNKYEVTVVATATPSGGTASTVVGMKAVTVTVENGEDAGSVSLSQRQPYVATPVTASLGDGDGGISGTTWQWFRGGTPDGTPSTIVVPADAGECTEDTEASEVCFIKGATSSTHTPVQADSGNYLTAQASYYDSVQPSGVKRMAQEETENRVTVRPPSNAAPKFIDQDPDTAGTQNTEASRQVDENKASENVGNPVEAGDAQPLIYTLSGPDVGSFKLDNRGSGQIKTKVKLDYETQDSYVLTLTATDPLGASASITVNITVRDQQDGATITLDTGMLTYAENGTDSVATFSATDQDGDAIVWSLGGDDAGDFTITGGVLMFKKSPNYESPADKDTDNEYKVTVQATGGTEEITVTVTNVDEAGSVRMSDLQPQIGKPVTATLSDPDGQHTRTRWQWSRSADNSAWTDIAGARSASYSSVAGDAGMYLRAMATYYDPLGEDAETAMGATDFMVEGEPAINAAPKFPDQDPGEAGVQNAVAMLEMNEETAAGTSIGDPVVATDADNDPLLYAFDDTPDLKDGPNNDVARFTIDNETGQIKVGKKLDADTGQSEDEDSSGVTDLPTELTAEDTGDEVNEAAENNNMYILKVTATDPSDAPATIFVVVTVKEVDEAPTFAPAPANPSSIKVTEGMQIGAGENPAGVTYVATDPEGATNEVAYTLAGDDVAKFSLPENGAGGVLTFKGETSTDDGYFRPNFESPADKNKDNKYEVTVVATATPSGGTASTVVGMKAVTVTVENGEDAGSVSLSQRQPYVGTPVTASLGDGDGGISGTTWQWFRGGTPDGTPSTIVVPADAGECTEDTEASEVCFIKGATSSTHTPVQADSGNYLTAQASYYDSVQRSGVKRMAQEETENRVTARPSSNAAPRFVDQDPDTAGTQNTEASRQVDENKASENVGNPVEAGDAQPLIYTLSGPDVGSFKLDNRGSGQIKTKVKLDYETQDSYVLTLTATDPLGASASITVNITVRDQQDGATITLGPGPANNAPAFDDGSSTTRMVAENAAAGAYVGDPVTATDEDDDSLTYSGGSMYFDVNDDGQIMVAEGAMLDYEMDDMHTVTVTASDGEDSDSITVTVRVTDMYPGCEMQGGDAANMYLNNDCEALLDSKDALGGSLNWDEAMPINDWDGFQNRPMPSLAGDPMRVTMLYLQNRELDGEIPAALGRLDALVYLNLHSNSLDGMVPDALGSLSNLERLYVNDNELAGIGNLSGATSLEILWAHRNEMSGMVPTQLPSSLTQLMLFGNDLTAGIPDLSMLTSLERLYLSKNENLGGTIPATLGQLTGLTRLGLLDTGLTGDIPDGLGSLVSLELLDLRDNMLSGSIPDDLGDMSSLKQLYLRENQLDGSIPDTLGQLASLERLWLHGNMLSGSIPMELGDLSALKQLHLNDNRLTGEIPSELGDLTNLERWFLSGNQLTGCVPAGLAAVADNDMAELGLTACQ